MGGAPWRQRVTHRFVIYGAGHEKAIGRSARLGVQQRHICLTHAIFDAQGRTSNPVGDFDICFSPVWTVAVIPDESVQEIPRDFNLL
jgi:hypothetical protein